jgi:hypothetical protein
MEAVIQVTVKNIGLAVLLDKTVPIVGKNSGTGGILVLQSQPINQWYVYELLAGACRRHLVAYLTTNGFTSWMSWMSC